MFSEFLEISCYAIKTPNYKKKEILLKMCPTV